MSSFTRFYLPIICDRCFDSANNLTFDRETYRDRKPAVDFSNFSFDVRVLGNPCEPRSEGRSLESACLGDAG